VTAVAAIDQTTDPAGAGYYGQPIVAPHVWIDGIGWYFFTGGLAGASAVTAFVADAVGLDAVAKQARRAMMIGLVPSPVLLIADLGRPARFVNMLRVFKPTSPMNMGSWLLAAFGPAATGSWLLGEWGRAGVWRRVLAGFAAVSGALVSTYTAVLVADTATPAWYEARNELPFDFAASSTASAGAVITALSAMSGSPDPIGVALGAGGAIAEAGAGTIMTHRLGELSTYRSDPSARRFDRLAKVLSVGGAVGLVVSRRNRVGASIASTAVLASSLCTRLAVLRAGTASAQDPRAVLVQQRRG
jgi:formate-dependent nitrite reductase membrane component NrfD